MLGLLALVASADAAAYLTFRDGCNYGSEVTVDLRAFVNADVQVAELREGSCKLAVKSCYMANGYQIATVFASGCAARGIGDGLATVSSPLGQTGCDMFWGAMSRATLSTFATAFAPFVQYMVSSTAPGQVIRS